MNQPLTKDAIQSVTNEQASEYDHVLLIDQSGSMTSPSNRYKGKNRWEEVAEYAQAFSNFLSKVDEDGFTLITFNSVFNVTDGIKSSDAVSELFTKQQPGGGTMLAPALQAGLNKLKQSGKKGILHIFLDGEAADREAVVETIMNAVKGMNADADLAFNFMQVGNDSSATKFLQMLDDDLQQKGAKFDAVNTMNISDSDSLTPQQIIWLALND